MKALDSYCCPPQKIFHEREKKNKKKFLLSVGGKERERKGRERKKKGENRESCL
jgi:hypothetical protein